MSEPDIDHDAERVLDLLRPRRRRAPRLAAPLREARDLEVATPVGAVMAWRLDPWGGSPTTPATLLVHGWEDDNALWGPLMDALMEVGRPVVAFDLPGHGFSPATDCSVGWAAAAIRAVADALGPIDSVVGHSFGCPAAVAAMAEGLRIERVVLMATPLPSDQSHARHWSRAQTELGVGDAVMERARALAFERKVAVAGFDYPALAATMTAQALLIHSLDDDGADPDNSRTLADAWGRDTAAAAALQWTEGLGHRLIAQDAATLARVAAFLEATD